jgi:hypothetical protein
MITRFERKLKYGPYPWADFGNYPFIIYHLSSAFKYGIEQFGDGVMLHAPAQSRPVQVRQCTSVTGVNRVRHVWVSPISLRTHWQMVYGFPYTCISSNLAG